MIIASYGTEMEIHDMGGGGYLTREVTGVWQISPHPVPGRIKNAPEVYTVA